MEAARVADRRERDPGGPAASLEAAFTHGAPSARGEVSAPSAVLRDAAGIGVAVGAFGLSYGAIAVASGFSVLQTCALSALMFTGASQFALVGVVGGGGSLVAGALTALLLGGRNALYGLRLSSVLGVRGARRAVAAHFVIDESAAMALARGRRGFWATGLAVFVCWNAGTAAGALGGTALADPHALGLDAAAPAAFLALLAPRLRGGSAAAIALAAAAAALVAVPLTPAGVPVLVAALVAVLARP
jgi:predicted branched-subunit amino acid permease